jgi:hypothetical protein
LALAILGLGSAPRVEAQAAARPLPVWDAGPLLLPSSTASQRLGADVGPYGLSQSGLGSHRHTSTGLLVGGLIGIAATTVFLIGFCDDPDTQCGVDEVGRAVVLIAVPAAAVGALIGYLIRTED